jgi:predicted nucleotidyltransferase
VDRDALAASICRELRSAVPTSEAGLRGSLATGDADDWSDIELAWVVPDDEFDHAVTVARDVLDRAALVTSYRIDPDFARSDRRRVIYVRFAGVPLFWRLDLEVVARSIVNEDDYDRENPQARGAPEWSPFESALLNGLAALKSIYRGNQVLALELLQRGAVRAGVQAPAQASPEEVATYAERIAGQDADVRVLADELIATARPGVRRQHH